jgi:hypothetical protein
VSLERWLRTALRWVSLSGGAVGRDALIRRLRAVAITAALVMNGIYALPYQKITDEERQDPEWQKPGLDVWWRWFGPVLPVERETFDRVVRGGLFLQHDVVAGLRWPFKPIFGTLHVNQQWGLFAVVTQQPDALVIEVRRGGDKWETLYRRLDGEHDWHDRQLKYRRIRGVWDGVKEEPKGTYKRMSMWIARVIFTEQPDVDRVRVLLEKGRETLPWEPVDDTRTRRAEKYYRRHELMKNR